MKLKDISTVKDLENYIEGILNDFESGISDKEEASSLIADLIINVENVIEKGVLLREILKEWIDVKDKLPEIGERVLIYCNSQGIQICHRGYLNKKIVWLFSRDLGLAELNITQWQLLPNLPKENY